jgi:hypothetical protein
MPGSMGDIRIQRQVNCKCQRANWQGVLFISHVQPMNEIVINIITPQTRQRSPNCRSGDLVLDLDRHPNLRYGALCRDRRATNFTTRRDLSSGGSIHFSDIIFMSCTSPQSGGALCIFSTNAEFCLSNCQSFCYATPDHRGCIHSDSIKSACIFGFSGTVCPAEYAASFCFLFILSSSTGVVDFNESSGARDTASRSSFWVGLGVLSSPGSREVVQLVSSINNCATNRLLV